MGNEKVSDKTHKGICFVISPMGDEDSETRRQSDLLLRHVIEPAAGACGYTVVSAAKLLGSAPITYEVIQHLVSAPLVIADLTGGNANVIYELALRHIVRKPFIQIIEKNSRLIFDLNSIRTIKFDISTVSSQDKAKNDLIDYINEAEKTPRPVTPISLAGLNEWIPFTKRETAPPNAETNSNAKKRMNEVLQEFLENLAMAEATPPEVRQLLKVLMENPRVYLLKDTGADLDAAGILVKKVPSGGKISATSSLQHHDADEREIYRDVLNDALKRHVTYRKIICSDSNITVPRYETWMAEFAEKANLIRNGSIKANTVQLLHYPFPMSVDVLISQDESGGCCDMVAGFAGGEGHGGFKTDDPRMVKEWLDIYFEAKIIPDAQAHTEQVLNGSANCPCLDFLMLLENASRDANKSAEDTQGNDGADSP